MERNPREGFVKAFYLPRIKFYRRLSSTITVSTYRVSHRETCREKNIEENRSEVLLFDLQSKRSQQRSKAKSAARDDCQRFVTGLSWTICTSCCTLLGIRDERCVRKSDSLIFLKKTISLTDLPQFHSWN